MTAEVLRQASDEMRADWEWEDADPEEATFYLAVADWMVATVSRYDAVVDTFAPGSRAGSITAAENVTGWTEALAVARAYLGAHP